MSAPDLVVTEVALQGGERDREPDTATDSETQDCQAQDCQYQNLQISSSPVQSISS